VIFIIQNFDLVKRLQQQNSSSILSELSSRFKQYRNKEGKLHNVAGRQEMQNRKIHSAKIKLGTFQSFDPNEVKKINGSMPSIIKKLLSRF
jgi:hypothetical protein